MEKLNFTKTVYSITFRQSQEELLKLLSNKDIILNYEKTYLKKQDVIHLNFFESWKNWSKKLVNINFNELKYFYPTAGSSEAIREQIVYLNSIGKTLVVFDSEYEGYEAIAKAINMPIKKINRFVNIKEIYNQLLKLDSKKDVFFISEPSSIDGCCWENFYNFLDYTNYLNISVYLDVAYIGLTNDLKLIDIYNYKNIDGIFFSLSKSFGVYYHRIGGVILKNESPLLYGNMWFKNIFSLIYGQLLLDNYQPGFNHEELKKAQNLSIIELQKKYNIRFIKADVLIIANCVYVPETYLWQKEYQRSQLNPYLRVCLSPVLDKYLNE